MSKIHLYAIVSMIYGDLYDLPTRAGLLKEVVDSIPGMTEEIKLEAYRLMQPKLDENTPFMLAVQHVEEAFKEAGLE